MKVTMIVDQKRVNTIFSTDEREFFNRPRHNFFDPRNDPATLAAFAFHTLFIAYESKFPNRQPDEVKR
jgi:hypothetical protein